jgi:hypothetical protein
MDIRQAELQNATVQATLIDVFKRRLWGSSKHAWLRGAHGPSLRSGIVFTFSLLCIDTCRVRAGMLWVPRILFFLSPASPHACLFGYLPVTMLLLRALTACISFLLLILLGSRQFCPVYLCSFCFASLWLTVLPLLVGAQL